MKQVYLIRHGDADYSNDCLTDEGRARVRGLSRTLEGLLPLRERYSVVSSPSGRARETAELLLPMISEKSEETVYIDEDKRLSELRSMGTKEEMERYGEQNLALFEEYYSDPGLFTAHERIIRAMAFAISNRFGITLPDEFDPGKTYRKMMVRQLMREYRCTEARAIAAVQELADPFIESPVLRPGYGLFFDLEKKVVSFVVPDY